MRRKEVAERKQSDIEHNVLLIGDARKNRAIHDFVSSLSELKEYDKCTSLAKGIYKTNTQDFDIIIIDYFLSDGTALDFLHHQKVMGRANSTVIILMDKPSYPMSLCAYRKGANQVIVKDQDKHYLHLLEKVMNRIFKLNKMEFSNSCKNLNINHALIGLDLSCKVNFLNSAAVGYLGKSLTEVMGKDLFDVLPRMDLSIKELISECLQLAKWAKQPQPIGRVSLANIESNLVKVELMVYPIFLNDKEISGFILSMQESAWGETQRENNEKQYYDALTGVFSREGLLNRLNQVIVYSGRYHQNCAIIHIDVDGFKAINDALGHSAADELLKMIANRISHLTRDVDVVSRVGADEFILVAPNIQRPQNAARIADKIMRAFKQPFSLNEVQHFLTLSIGIALYPNDANSLESILQCANSAKNTAKSNGKNNYQFYKSSLTQEAGHIVSLANDLHIAIEKNQFELYFQPQVDCRDYKVIGLEALIRWNHPQKGMISPALFIPIAEQMGMICEVGRWVMNKSFESVLTFEQQGVTDFVLGINLSVNQFMRESFIDEVEQCLKRYKISPSRIEFEITESIFAHDIPYIIEKLNTLKEMGFQLVMDDFGTGYSCLSYLKDLPLEGIKIDRSFVQSMGGTDKNQYLAIVSAIITLAKQLNIKTLAEGIETIEQAQYLADLGCDHLQGFYFARPLPMQDCLEYLNKHINYDKEQNPPATG